MPTWHALYAWMLLSQMRAVADILPERNGPHNWVPAVIITLYKIISEMCYGAEMMLLEKALPLTARTGPFVRVWQQYWTENIVDMSLSAMAELRALRNYGLDLIKRTTSASQGNPEIETDPQSSRRHYITTNLSQSSTADCPA